MRASLTIIAIGWALYRAYASGNYLRIRWYLWSLLGAALLGEAYLHYGHDSATAYWIIYSVVTAAILTNAWLVSFEMVLKNPLRRVVIPSAMASGLVGLFLAIGPDTSPSTMLLLVQACVLAVAGLQIVLSTPIVFSEAAFIWGEDRPLRTLGLLWMTQAVMFYVMAAGWQLFPARWYAIGDWLPATVVIMFMVNLGLALRPLSQVPVHVRSRG